MKSSEHKEQILTFEEFLEERKIVIKIAETTLHFEMIDWQALKDMGLETGILERSVSAILFYLNAPIVTDKHGSAHLTRKREIEEIRRIYGDDAALIIDTSRLGANLIMPAHNGIFNIIRFLERLKEEGEKDNEILAELKNTYSLINEDLKIFQLHKSGSYYDDQSVAGKVAIINDLSRKLEHFLEVFISGCPRPQ